MYSIRKFVLIIYLNFFSFFLLSNDINYQLTFQKRVLENSWELPFDLPDSFKKYNENIYSISAKKNKLSITLNKNNFQGEGVRSSYPKRLSSKIISKEFLLSYELNNTFDINFNFGNSKTSPEFFDCYQNGSLIIGGCDEANFRINSDLEKYEILGSNLLFIEGKSKKIGLEVIHKSAGILFDEYSYGFSIKNTKFNWLSPIEDIDSPVILNSVINGIRVGSTIDEILLDLPQRNRWRTNIHNLGAYKELDLVNFKIFIELDVLFGNRKNFYKFNDSNNSNVIMSLGLRKKVQSVEFELIGTAYSNFLLWDKEELYNFRTKDFFDEKFGFLALKVKYDF